MAPQMSKTAVAAAAVAGTAFVSLPGARSAAPAPTNGSLRGVARTASGSNMLSTVGWGAQKKRDLLVLSYRGLVARPFVTLITMNIQLTSYNSCLCVAHRSP